MINRKYLMFSGPNCPSCLALKEELSKQSLPVEIVDVEENPDRAHDYHVMSLPHLVFIENDRTVDVMVGFSPRIATAITNFSFPAFDE